MSNGLYLTSTVSSTLLSQARGSVLYLLTALGSYVTRSHVVELPNQLMSVGPSLAVQSPM